MVIGPIFLNLIFDLIRRLLQGAFSTLRHYVVFGRMLQNLSICTEELRAGIFLKQRISLAILIANVAGVLGTINDKKPSTKFFICNFIYYFFLCRVACSY